MSVSFVYCADNCGGPGSRSDAYLSDRLTVPGPCFKYLRLELKHTSQLMWDKQRLAGIRRGYRQPSGGKSRSWKIRGRLIHGKLRTIASNAF